MNRTPRLAALLIAAAFALTACAPAASQAAGEDATGCRDSDVALADLAILEAPREHVGESTACLPTTSIEPVADDVTPSLPATVTDNQGTEVTVTDTSRILALDIYGSLAATVFGLGLGDSVVGRDTSTGFPEAADLPLVTQNGHELNGEAILDLQPTVIITDSSIGPWDVVLQMRDAGVPVVVVTPERSIENTGEVIMAVADALGVHDAGVELAERVQAEIDDVVAQVAGIAPEDVADRPRIMFFYVRGNAGIYYIFGAGSGTDSLITSLGGVDVATEIGWQGMRPMTAEALVDAAPDVILMMTKGLESVDGVDGLLETVPAIAETPAGQHRRIVDMSDYEVLSFGPRTAAVIEALARAIYAPEQSGPVE
ncbi:heme/hemin ABC transporter substrate-binding protein [Microbacterium marinilacus]|uniref:Hemin ABC transporter substrate-binding protein n=1 Tax=Microbacterium marinilacus TaxID=415209 RepID=A0ABP7BVY5_9MICO|nr:ABC transporter substrate-binding protein [Microbacterium marinilacus]MBY0688287.1 ABC transporter substrate-binding protein [Microbacterium marinilacus]